MPQVLFNLQFRGAAAPSGEGVMKATTSATSSSMTTIMGADGVHGSFTPVDGGLAFFESEVRVTGPEAFLEAGSITFGEGDDSISFSTVGQGYLAPSADPKLMAGAITWKVNSGEGQFAGASGLIVSNFTLSDSGDVVDHQFGLIFVK